MKLPGGPKPLPRVLCRGWRSSTGVQVRCIVGYVQAGEPGGEVIPGGRCLLCSEFNHRAAEIRVVREMRAIERRAKQPHEINPMTDQDWEGFRDGE